MKTPFALLVTCLFLGSAHAKYSGGSGTSGPSVLWAIPVSGRG
jgi:hypothetical protein